MNSDENSFDLFISGLTTAPLPLKIILWLELGTRFGSDMEEGSCSHLLSMA